MVNYDNEEGIRCTLGDSPSSFGRNYELFIKRGCRWAVLIWHPLRPIFITPISVNFHIFFHYFVMFSFSFIIFLSFFFIKVIPLILISVFLTIIYILFRGSYFSTSNLQQQNWNRITCCFKKKYP